MSVYYVIYADTADAKALTTTSATYSTVRNSTVATTTTDTTVLVGQTFATPNYQIGQYFGQFDTSAVPAGNGVSNVLSVNVGSAGAQRANDVWELREVSALTNKIAGASLSGFTLYGSLAIPGTGRQTITISDITGLSRSATLKLLVHSQNERLNTAPTGDERSSFNTADTTGTSGDPFLQFLFGSTWTLVGVSNVVEISAATAHALVTTGISGLASGDLLVACISSRIASTSAITLPSADWTEVDHQYNNNTQTTTSATPSGIMAYAIRGGSDPALTFTHPTNVSVALGCIIAYRNSAQTAPLDVHNSITSGTAVTAIDVAAGVTTTQDDDLLVCLRAGGQESTMTSWAAATDPTTASGATNTTSDPAMNAWIERVDSNTVTGADTSISVFDAVKTAAGSTGNMTGTASQGSAHVVVTGAFKIVPAASGAIVLTYNNIIMQAVQRAATW